MKFPRDKTHFFNTMRASVQRVKFYAQNIISLSLFYRGFSRFILNIRHGGGIDFLKYVLNNSKNFMPRWLTKNLQRSLV